ncbi:6359_t:CDS:2, partial [Ambispora leptoticha]
AFYMKNNLDGKTVACFDLLFPEIGELIGGSLREDNYQTLQEKADKQSLGLERLIMLISGTENIRDTIAFPRFPGKIESRNHLSNNDAFFARKTFPDN